MSTTFRASVTPGNARAPFASAGVTGLLPLVVLSLSVAAFGQTPTNRDLSHHTDLKEQGYPINSGLRTVPAKEAALEDTDIVIGVAIGEEARAYPLNAMWGPSGEVLNDALGGAPVSITWCSLAHTAIAYDPRLDGHQLELGEIGAQNGVSILYDRQSGSWWSQIVGKALRGPMQGRELRQWPSTLTTWGRWRQLHPATTVYVDPGPAGPRRFTEETWSWILTLTRDGSVANEDLVAGISGPKSARAWLLRRLYRAGRVVNDALDGEPVVVFLAADTVTVRILRRTVGKRTLTFRAAGDSLRDDETGSVWDPMTGRAQSGPLAGKKIESVLFTTALWYAWHSQRPDTTLWD